MSIINKLIDSMKISPDDDYEEDDYDLDEEEEVKPRRSFFPKREPVEDDGEEDAAPERPRFLKPASSKVVPLKRNLEVSMLRPKSVEDSREICDQLLSGKAVVLNLEGISLEMAQRIIDFTCGATYSMEGHLEKISNSIFIATPSNVELSGEFPEFLTESALSGYAGGMTLRL